jgi:hypothetical protein
VFTAPVPAGTASPVTAELSSPTLSADELEIFYTIGMPASPQAAWSIQRSTRAARGDVFSAGAAVPELDAACPGSNRKDIALSSDGLGVYVLCEAPDADNLLTGPLRHATRASTGGSWTVDATSYGTVGWSPTLSGDQLTLVTDSTITAPGAPTLFTRTSVSAPFGSGSLLTGLPALSSLDLAADGSFVFGKQGRMLVLAKRAAASDSFSVVNADLLMQSPLPTALGAPAHSADCSALYYIQVDAAPSGGNVWTIRAATP